MYMHMITHIFFSLFFEYRLLPNDAIKKANGRFAIEYYSSKVLPNLYGAIRNPSDQETYDKAVDEAFKRVSRLLQERKRMFIITAVAKY